MGEHAGDRAPWRNTGAYAADYARLAELHGQLAAIYQRPVEESRQGLAVSPIRALVPNVDVQPAAPVRLLTVRDLASLLRLSPRAVRRMRSEGRLPPAIDVGGSVVHWRRQAIESWLASREGAR